VLYTPIGMRLKHHALELEFQDEWLDNVRSAGFVPTSSSYVAKPTADAREMYEVEIAEIAPVQRAPGVPILKDDDENGIAVKDRVESILEAFQLGIPLFPVEVVRLDPNGVHKFKLTAGVHRLYCSMAIGFTRVPVVDGFDWASLDR